MSVSYDPEADAIYVRLSRKPVARTSEARWIRVTRAPKIERDVHGALWPVNASSVTIATPVRNREEP